MQLNITRYDLILKKNHRNFFSLENYETIVMAFLKLCHMLWCLKRNYLILLWSHLVF